MRNKSTYVVGSFMLLAVISCGALTRVQAQDSEQYVISARAGGVNLASGDVTVKRRGEGQRQQLASRENLESRDAVRTGSSGHVEILLNPGSYLRAAENSEFELTDSSLDSLRIRLIRGSAVVEAAGADGERMLIEIATPQSSITIDRRGLYRINVLPSGGTEVFVRKGKALVAVAGTTTTEVKDGKMAIVAGGQVTVAKFDKKARDTFDAWSEQRAETLVAASHRLSERGVAKSFSRYGGNSLWGRRGYNSFGGMWVYDPFSRYNTFFPFYSGWSSPYGYGYSHGFGISRHSHFTNGFRSIFSSRPGQVSRTHGSDQRQQSASFRAGSSSIAGTSLVRASRKTLTFDGASACDRSSSLRCVNSRDVPGKSLH